MNRLSPLLRAITAGKFGTGPSEPEAAPVAGIAAPVVATVAYVHPDGRVRLEGPGGPFDAEVSPHLPSLQPGQRVLATGMSAESVEAPLVFAAWPIPGVPTGWRFDPANATLHLHADLITVQGQAGVRLQCGDTSLALDPKGRLDLRAQDITAAAARTHRIEGGSIEFN